MVAAHDSGEYLDAELVREGRTAFVGYDRVPSRIVEELLRRALLKDDSDGKGMERYVINEDSRKAAIDPSWIRPELLAAIQNRAPVSNDNG